MDNKTLLTGIEGELKEGLSHMHIAGTYLDSLRAQLKEEE